MAYLICEISGLSAISFFDFGVNYWPKVRTALCHVMSSPSSTTLELTDL
jgi:hypothetical protein